MNARERQRRIDLRRLRKRIREIRTALNCLTPESVAYQLKECQKRREQAAKLVSWAEAGEQWLERQVANLLATHRELARTIKLYQYLRDNSGTLSEVTDILIEKGLL